MKEILKKANDALEKWVESRKQYGLDFFDGLTIVSHQDGSYFVFQNSNAKRIDVDGVDILMVATEHCGYFTFFLADVQRWSCCLQTHR